MNRECYKKGELKAGIEVYVPHYFSYGWGRNYPYPSWERCVIKTVSPKGNVATLEDGRKWNVDRYTGKYNDFFRYDSEMANDAKMKEMFKRFVDARMKSYKYLGSYQLLNDAAVADRESLEKAIAALEAAGKIFGHKGEE